MLANCRSHAALLLALGGACRHAAPDPAAPDPATPDPAMPDPVAPAVVTTEPPTSPCTIVDLVGEGRDRDAVDRTLIDHRDRLRDCYAQLQERDPTAAGVARIQFVINPDGLAGFALMQRSTVDDVPFSYCLAEALTTIPFVDIYSGHAMSQTVVTCDFSVP